ncbi:MAG: hypothetical protein ACFCUJ_01175 [Thiotrichales bacterium]
MLVAMATVVWSPIVPAEEWFIAPRASVSLEHNDNIRLVTQNQEVVTGIVLDAGVDLSNESETTKITLTPSVQLKRYQADSDLDSNIALLEGGIKHSMERAALGLTADIRRDTTLVSELEDSGNLLTTTDRNYYSLNPSAAYQLSERSTVTASAGFSRTDYDQGSRTDLVDYRSDTLSASYSYRLTEVDDLSVTAYRQDYQATSIDSEATTTGLQLGLSRRFSEFVTGRAMLGTHTTDYKFLVLGVFPFESSQSGTIGELGITAKLELTELEAALSQKVVPSAIGDVQEQTALRVTASRRLTEKLKGSVGATLLKNDAFEQSTSDRDYRDLNASLSYQWLPEWWLTGSYNYRWQKYASQNDDADSNVLRMGVEYRGLKQGQ